jgi:hypothetical protein
MENLDVHATRLWEEAFDELERHLARGERLIASADAEAVADWAAPEHLGPLPRHLVQRAQSLLERQQSVISRLRPLMASTRQRLQVGDRIGQATAQPTTPVYIDVSA